MRAWRWLPGPASLAASSRHQALPDKPSIAVLPFTNMSGDPEQEYFAEDIIIDLTKLSNLRVVARNSSFAYKNAKMTVPQIAAELRADFVLSGSIRRSQDSVRITAQLVDGPRDEHIWAERYDRQLSNIFELQSEIATNIVRSLTGSFSPPEEMPDTKPATNSAEAYEYYLRARLLIREMTRRSVELALDMFRQSVALDPGYALAYCGLADCANVLMFHYDDANTRGENATEYALKALRIDPDLSDAHACYARAFHMPTTGLAPSGNTTPRSG